MLFSTDQQYIVCKSPHSSRWRPWSGPWSPESASGIFAELREQYPKHEFQIIGSVKRPGQWSENPNATFVIVPDWANFERAEGNQI